MTKEILASQSKKLEEILDYLSTNSSYYKRVFEENRIDIKKIKSPDDLSVIPFTTKDDLALYNDDFLCVPKNKIADFVTTSGTLSDPVAFYLTAKDVERLANNEAEAFRCANGTEDDIYQLMTTIDRRFMAGLAYWMGPEQWVLG